MSTCCRVSGCRACIEWSVSRSEATNDSDQRESLYYEIEPGVYALQGSSESGKAEYFGLDDTTSSAVLRLDHVLRERQFALRVVESRPGVQRPHPRLRRPPVPLRHQRPQPVRPHALRPTSSSPPITSGPAGSRSASSPASTTPTMPSTRGCRLPHGRCDVRPLALHRWGPLRGLRPDRGLLRPVLAGPGRVARRKPQHRPAPGPQRGLPDQPGDQRPPRRQPDGQPPGVPRAVAVPVHRGDGRPLDGRQSRPPARPRSTASTSAGSTSPRPARSSPPARSTSASTARSSRSSSRQPSSAPRSPTPIRPRCGAPSWSSAARWRRSRPPCAGGR